MGKVFLVGAGPGDPELLTLKAVRLLKSADVVLYDRLICPDILQYTSSHCELVYVGKEDGKHLLPQEEINRLLLHYAKKYSTVIRLKGGDPFVFGRGGEEAAFLKRQGIPFEVVPGVSSCISVPAYAGIPLTYRGIAASFAVITGHESPEKKGGMVDWESLSGIHTLVFLMCVKNRAKIAKKLIEIGRKEVEPVALIEKGTNFEQKVTFTNLKDIAEGKIPLSPPAIMVVGEVVQLGKLLAWWFPKKSLEYSE